MHKSSALLLLLSAAAVAAVFDVSGDNTDLIELCRQFPKLHACARINAAAAAQVVEKRKSQFVRFGKRSGAAADGPVMLEPEQENEIKEEQQKRKSAFVRFGKRSQEPLEETFEEPAKRKSAFVRFGKRKSSYVRFG